MKHLKKTGKNLEKIKPILPAVLAAAVVTGTLCGYKAPEYKVQAAQQTDASQPSGTEKKETTKAAKGNFDLKDGTYKGSGTGYGGQITVEVDIKDKSITAIRIVSAPGEDEPFFTRAQGVIEKIIQQQKTDVDVVSGATYSSNGIISAVKNALTGEKDNRTVEKKTAKGTSTKLSAVKEADGYKDGTYRGSGTGYGGTITVEVVIKNGKISKISVVDASGEDAAYFNRAKKLLDDIVAKQTTNVDTVSGATYSSNGLITAVRSALAKAAVNGASADTTEDKNTTPAKPAVKKEPVKVEKVKETNTYKDGVYEGSAEGFGGPVTVQVTVKNGKIASVKITEHSGEDAAYFNKAKVLADQIVKKQSTNVDTISGATFSSNGIIQAVRNALAKAVTSKDNSSQSSNKNNSTSNKNNQTIKPAAGKFPYPDGTYRGSGEGYLGGTTTVEIVIKNKTLQSVKVVSTEDDAAFFNRAKKVIDQMISTQTTDVDIVSGATFSSNGLISAVKDALDEAAGKHETEPDPGDNKEDGKEDEPDTSVHSYDVTAKCSPDDAMQFTAYTLAMTVEIQDGKIVAVNDVYEKNAKNNYNKSYINFAVRKIVPNILANGVPTGVDTVSGATCSSKAILEGCQKALEEDAK